MNIQEQSIDVETAEEMLSRNVRNRQVSPTRVDLFAADMAAGRWLNVGDPIRFADDGALLDGQHRLLAIVQSGTPQRMLVISGLDRTSQDVMDDVRARRLHDVLRIRGEANHTALAAALPYIWGMENDVDFAINMVNWRPSRSVLLGTLDAHPGLRESCAPGMRLNAHVKIPASVAVFRHYQLATVDPDDRNDFWDRLCRGDFNGEKDPLAQLYKRITLDATSHQGRLNTIQKHALLVKTWNFYRDGAEVSNLKWRRGGSSPESFPVAS